MCLGRVFLQILVGRLVCFHSLFYRVEKARQTQININMSVWKVLAILWMIWYDVVGGGDV